MPEKDPKEMSVEELEKKITTEFAAKKSESKAAEQKKFTEESQKKLETSPVLKTDAKVEPAKAEPLKEGVPPAAKEVVTPPKTEDKDKEKVGEWLDKKGLPKDPLVIAKHYRELEREFHRQKHVKQEAIPAQVNPPAAIPVQDKGNLFEMMAQDLGIEKTDAERVARIAHFISENYMTQRIKPLEDNLKRLQANSVKSNEVMELAVNEPSFSAPEVQKEIEAQIRKDPAIFESDLPITEAYNRALQEIGRKVLIESQRQIDGVQDAPPKTLSGGVIKPTPQTDKLPNQMSVDELEQRLNARGIRTKH